MRAGLLPSSVSSPEHDWVGRLTRESEASPGPVASSARCLVALDQVLTFSDCGLDPQDGGESW